MTFKNKKILVMCCRGLYQDYLIQRLDQEFTVCGIVRHEYPREQTGPGRLIRKLATPTQLLRHIYARIKIAGYNHRKKPLLRQLFYAEGQPPTYNKKIPELGCSDVNSPEVFDFICTHTPDIICVNGTNLLREPLLEHASGIQFGIINLHTGLSPYSRGGNCNLYMLLENHPELVGITVHYIDKGIDSGDIVISAQVDFECDDIYETIDAKSFYLGVRAIVEACIRIFNGSAERVKQWEKGKLFLKRTGYCYQPYQRVQINNMIEQGLIHNYLNNAHANKSSVRTVGNLVSHDVNTYT